jgi:hypothetical protein
VAINNNYRFSLVGLYFLYRNIHLIRSNINCLNDPSNRYVAPLGHIILTASQPLFFFCHNTLALITVFHSTMARKMKSKVTK